MSTDEIGDTPTAATTGLAEVLAAHREAEVEGLGGWVMACDCGWVSAPTSSGDAQWAAHVAEQITAHLAARLSDPDVVEATARERMVELVMKWHPKSGGTCGSQHHRTLTSWPCEYVRLVRSLATTLGAKP